MQLLSELVQIFAAEYPELLLRIEEAARGGDADSLREASHKLKGSLLQFSAPIAAAAAADLEILAANHSLKDIAPAVARVKAEIDNLVPLMQNMISGANVRAIQAGEN